MLLAFKASALTADNGEKHNRRNDVQGSTAIFVHINSQLWVDMSYFESFLLDCKTSFSRLSSFLLTPGGCKQRCTNALCAMHIPFTFVLL